MAFAANQLDSDSPGTNTRIYAVTALDGDVGPFQVQPQFPWTPQIAYFQPTNACIYKGEWTVFITVPAAPALPFLTLDKLAGAGTGTGAGQPVRLVVGRPAPGT